MSTGIAGTLGIDFTVVSTTRLHPLGLEIDCEDGCRRKYIRAGATILAMQCLKIDAVEGPNDYTPTTALLDVLSGVAEVAIADNSYGWVITHGVCQALMSNGITVLQRLATSATLGGLTLAIVTGGGATAAEVERILSLASGKGAICIIVPAGADVYGTIFLN